MNPVPTFPPGWSPSASQRRVLETPDVTYLGHDDAGRPVVSAMSGIPRQARTFAVTRAGDPADVRPPVVAWGRDEAAPCEASTPGCAIRHLGDRGGCSTW
jgi:hypothetical protein